MSAEGISRYLNPARVGRGVWRRLADVRAALRVADAEPPKYHVGPVWANRFGLQVFRAVSRNLAYHLRGRHAQPSLRSLVATIERDGIVLIPDFLPPEQFDAVRAEFDRCHGAGNYARGWPEDVEVAEDVMNVLDQPEAFGMTHQLLRHNATIHAVVAAVLRRPVRLPPHISARAWRRMPAQARGNLAGAAHIHADVHYPTCKAWLYLNDIDEGNGAFVYCRGSHHMTPSRLGYEYEASVRVARSRRDGTCHRTIPYGVVRKPTPKQIRAMGLREESITGKANTLVIANTQGFHRMGEFTDDRPREKIYICFRNVESRQNYAA